MRILERSASTGWRAASRELRRQPFQQQLLLRCGLSDKRRPVASVETPSSAPKSGPSRAGASDHESKAILQLSAPEGRAVASLHAGGALELMDDRKEGRLGPMR